VNPLRLQALALGASLAHVLVDFQVGLYGAGAAGSRGAVAALVLLAGAWSAFAQGVVGFVACPPPCGGTTGMQDAAHFLSLVFGAWASVGTARAFGEGAGRVSWWPTVFAVALIVAGFVLEGMTFATTR